MGLAEKVSEIVCSARRDVMGCFRIGDSHYHIDWKGQNVTEREKKALLNFTWCVGMNYFEQDRHMPEMIEVRWGRNEKENATFSYPLVDQYTLELQQV